jgi:NTP pyrophosphatase (non-canonical NTP hydrolase)
MKESFLNELRRLNIERQKEWDPENKATLSFKGLEFAGEAGELASKIKKLARKTEFDFVGSDYDMTDIEEEVGDVLITLDLVCQKMGIDIEKVTKNKFNATSEKVGMKTKFEPDVIYIDIKDNEVISFDRRLKDHIAKVNLLKPHLAISSNSEESLIYAEEHLNYAQLLPIYQ